VGYAAGGSDKKSDKKVANNAAKSYFNSNIAAASVSHANSASTATTAGSANSLNGVVIVKSGDQPNPAGTQNTFTQPCPAGTNVIGGGAHSNSGNTAVNIKTALPARTPSTSAQPNGWRIDMNNASGGATTFQVYAICAPVNMTSNYAGAFASDTK
jgi:hypothetical protein